MSIHIFATTSYGSKAIAIEADTEDEARGILQRNTLSGINPIYRGTVSELMGEDNFAYLTNSDTYE